MLTTSDRILEVFISCVLKICNQKSILKKQIYFLKFLEKLSIQKHTFSTKKTNQSYLQKVTFFSCQQLLIKF